MRKTKLATLRAIPVGFDGKQSIKYALNHTSVRYNLPHGIQYERTFVWNTYTATV